MQEITVSKEEIGQDLWELVEAGTPEVMEAMVVVDIQVMSGFITTCYSLCNDVCRV